MRNTIFGLLSLLVCAPAMAFSIPAADGTYSGSGTLTRLSNNAQMNYSVTSTFDSSASTVSTHFVYSGYDYTLNFTVVDGQNGAFTILQGSNTVGSGQCTGNTCSIDLTYTTSISGPQHVAETTVYGDGTMSTTGHNYTSNVDYSSTQTLQR